MAPGVQTVKAKASRASKDGQQRRRAREFEVSVSSLEGDGVSKQKRQNKPCAPCAVSAKCRFCGLVCSLSALACAETDERWERPCLSHCSGNREGITVYHTVINSSAQRNSLTRPRLENWRELKTTRRGAKKLGYHPSNNNHTWHARRRGYADRDPTCRGTAASPAFLSRHRNHRRAPDPGGRHRQPRRPHPHHRCRRCRRCHRCRRHRPHHRSFPRLRRCPHRPSETATP